MFTKFLLIIVFLCPVSLMAQDKVFFYNLPTPTGVSPVVDDASKIAWNRWTTENFQIHAIDKTQGELLFRDIEQIKKWTLTRWGFPDEKFLNETRIFCAADTESMRKLFNIASSYAEVRGDVNYIWLVLDKPVAEVVPPAITIIAMGDLEKRYRFKMKYFAQRGLPLLNSTIPQIKKDFALVFTHLSGDNPAYFSEALITATEDSWKKLSPEKKQLFDIEAAILCLMIRKEYGERKFHDFVYFEDTMKVLEFKDFESLDSSYIRYVYYLSQQVSQNKTPDDYLEVVSPKGK